SGRFLLVLHFRLRKADQNYKYFENKSSLELGKPLMAAVVLCLSNTSQSRNKFLSDFSKTSHALKLIKGNALLFFNLRPMHLQTKLAPMLDAQSWKESYSVQQNSYT
ncbi:hypothetical protein RJ641_007549, partial [Dillenia turbinata]